MSREAPSVLAVVVSFGATSQLRDLLADLAAIPDCDGVLVENKADVDHGPMPHGVTILAGSDACNAMYGITHPRCEGSCCTQCRKSNRGATASGERLTRKNASPASAMLSIAARITRATRPGLSRKTVRLPE